MRLCAKPSERKGRGRTIQPTSLPLTVPASRAVGLIPASKRPLTKRRCSRLSSGRDLGLYLVAAWTITCSNSCCDWGGSVRPMKPSNRDATLLVLCNRGCMIHTFSAFERP